jgi:hypothetical protein
MAAARPSTVATARLPVGSSGKGHEWAESQPRLFANIRYTEIR